jgi:hypothetical protein
MQPIAYKPRDKRTAAPAHTGTANTHTEERFQVSQTESTRYGTCRHCRASIINRGKGWYHGPEVHVGKVIPAHFAEPMNVMDR